MYLENYLVHYHRNNIGYLFPPLLENFFHVLLISRENHTRKCEKSSSLKRPLTPFLKATSPDPPTSLLHLKSLDDSTESSLEGWLSNCCNHPLNLSYHRSMQSIDVRHDYYENCRFLSHTHCIHVRNLKTHLCCLCLTRPPTSTYSAYITSEECAGIYIPGINCPSILLHQ